MEQRLRKQIEVFLLTGTLLATGAAEWLPRTNKNNVLEQLSITVSADEYDGWSKEFYTYTYWNVQYKFRINVENQTAVIISSDGPGITNLPKSLYIPSKVPVKNGEKKTNYKVVEIANAVSGVMYAKKVETVYIPYSVTTLGGGAFSDFTSLKSVHFLNEDGIEDDTVCNVKYAYFNSFNEQSPFISSQMNEVGLAMVGNCLLRIEDTNLSTLNFSDSKYNAIKYIARNAFKNDKQLKTIYLPKNLQATSEYVSPNSLTTVYYWDSTTKSYHNLKTDIQNGKKNDLIFSFFDNCTGVIQDTVLQEQLSALIVKKALKKCGITYRGQVYNGYDAWKQYQIIHTLYTYVGKNYCHYRALPGKSVNYLEEMVQTEIFGLKGYDQTDGILCDDYAQMFEKLCIAAGIEAKYVKTIPEDNHAFNIVKIGNEWFNLDCCCGWIGATSLFLSPDALISLPDAKKNLVSCHRKSNEYSQYKCNCFIGDVNRDGKINMADAQAIQTAYLDLIVLEQEASLTKFQQVLCDVNRNGRIDAQDAQLVQRYFLESETMGNNYNSFEQFYRENFGDFTQFRP